VKPDGGSSSLLATRHTWLRTERGARPEPGISRGAPPPPSPAGAAPSRAPAAPLQHCPALRRLRAHTLPSRARTLAAVTASRRGAHHCSGAGATGSSRSSRSAAQTHGAFAMSRVPSWARRTGHSPRPAPNSGCSAVKAPNSGQSCSGYAMLSLFTKISRTRETPRLRLPVFLSMIPVHVVLRR